MTSLRWNADDNAWTNRVASKAFGELLIRVITDGEHDAPTFSQQRSVAMLDNLEPDDIIVLRFLTNDNIADLSVDELLDAAEDDGFDMNVTGATIPRLRDCTDSYALLNVATDTPVDSELTVVFKNGNSYGILRSEKGPNGLGWDDVACLNAAIDPSPDLERDG